MNVIDSTDLWYPDQVDPIGLDHGGNYSAAGRLVSADRRRYIVWVDPGRGNDEEAPRQALHVQANP